MPAQLRAPAPIAMISRTRTWPEFDALSGQFRLALQGGNDVLQQNDPNGLAIALVRESDWTDYQRIEANIGQTSFTAGRWVASSRATRTPTTTTTWPSGPIRRSACQTGERRRDVATGRELPRSRSCVPR